MGKSTIELTFPAINLHLKVDFPARDLRLDVQLSNIEQQIFGGMRGFGQECRDFAISALLVGIASRSHKRRLCDADVFPHV